MNVELQRASVGDAEVLLRMQQRAFAPLLEKYRDYETNPACESLARLAEKLRRAERHYYFILHAGRRAGAICVVDPGVPEGGKRISPLFILPEHQGRGLAQAAIRAAEDRHGAHGWTLETILQEAGNCHLYEKLGYRRTGEVQEINERMTLVRYAKP